MDIHVRANKQKRESIIQNTFAKLPLYIFFFAFNWDILLYEAAFIGNFIRYRWRTSTM